MNEDIKRHLISAGITFIAVFCTTMGVLLAQGAADPSSVSFDLLFSILMSASRAAIKAALERYVGIRS
jgi:hypothetical protein